MDTELKREAKVTDIKGMKEIRGPDIDRTLVN